MLFQQKMETIHYNAALAITGAIRGSSRDKLCQELGLKTLQQQHWYGKLCCFHKILKGSEVPFFNYSHNNIPFRTRLNNKIPALNVKNDFFKNPFFPSTIIEWNKLIERLKNLKVLKILKKEFYHSLGQLRHDQLP